LPPEIKEVRILSIGDYDQQADGGTHVKSTKEIGRIEFVRYNSKGKDNKRIYFRIKE
jgi:Ser-tRNA(Ala) deacylase AlaX